MAPATEDAHSAADAPGDEDRELRDALEMLVARVAEQDAGLQRAALEALRTQIRSSAVSSTSVPKALKYLREHFARLAAIHAETRDAENARFLADILSVVAMAVPEDVRASVAAPGSSPNLALAYRQRGQRAPVGGEWGHEYVRHLSLEVIDEKRRDPGADVAGVAGEIADFFLDHNAEPDACDVLYEVGQLGTLPGLLRAVPGRDHGRVCLYLESCVPYEAAGDDVLLLRVVHEVYLSVARDLPRALVAALRLKDAGRVTSVLQAAGTPDERAQLAYILARHRPSTALFSSFPDPVSSANASGGHGGEMAVESGSGDSAGSGHVQPLSAEERARLQTILDNAALSRRFRGLAAELGVLAPRVPEDVYKSHLQDAGGVRAAPSARQNLAAALVSGFLNAGFGTEGLLADGGVDGASEGGGASWVHRCRDHGVATTVATIGLVHLWDPEAGLAHLDRYLCSGDARMRAGAIVGVGLVHAGTRSEADPALALLREHLEGSAEGKPAEEEACRAAALVGLALAYAGSGRRDVADAILPHLGAPGAGRSIETAAMAALALGHVFVGSCDGDAASAILQTIMEARPEQLSEPAAPFLALALALIYLGKTEAEAAVVLETLAVVEHPIGGDAATLVKVCSHAGTGNVLKVQELLQTCTRRAVYESSRAAAEGGRDAAASTGPVSPSHAAGGLAGPGGDSASSSDPDGKAAAGSAGPDSPVPNNSDMAPNGVPSENSTAFAVLGIALICMAEDVGREMAHRLFAHLMQLGRPGVRRAVPLAIGVLHASDPAAGAVDVLGKYSHDHDKAVAVSAIFALGLVAAGTNNAKVAQMLRHLAAYYARDQDCLFVVRVAQGLAHAGKGTLGLSPLHAHRQLAAPNALAGLLTVCLAVCDAQALLLERSSHLLLFLATALYPRFMVALDAGTLEPLPALVRVGQAVDVVGQAGRPKTISGFQTHTSPVLLAHTERAELATDEFVSLTPVLENFVLVRRNPLWDDSSR